MPEQPIGHVTHYFDKIGVAVVQLTEAGLKTGATIHVVGKTDFSQTVQTMQIDHREVPQGQRGEEVAIKVDQPVRPKDRILLVTA